MSKLTFRADDDLVERVERLDASKSEVMREALRAYLDELDTVGSSHTTRSAPGTIDALVRERVDAMIEERLGGGRDVNVNISVESPGHASTVEDDAQDEQTRARTTPEDATSSERSGTEACGQCGEPVDSDHVYCPNCGEKRSRRVFCECGDELRTDWSFCPGCGRRTPAADVLDQS